MGDDKKKFSELVLSERDKGNVVFLALDAILSMSVKDIIKQPADGLLWDLNRDEATALSFMDEEGMNHWVNNFAVALVIRELKSQVAQLEEEITALKDALHQDEHFAIFTDDGWSIQHLVECRPDMTKCEIHKLAQIELNAGDTGRRGKFKVSIIDGVLDFERIPQGGDDEISQNKDRI